MREPDARDAARVLSLALLAIAIGWGLSALGLPGGLFQQAALFAVPVLYARAAGLGAWKANGFVRLPPSKAALVVVASLGTLWLLNGAAQLQERVIRAAGYARQAEEETQQIRQGVDEARKSGLAPALGLLAVLPPLCEETFFRGTLLRGLAARFGFGAALGLTSLLFALVHQHLVQTALMILLGCYFGALVYLTGSLWAGILAHALNNAAVVLATWAWGDRLEHAVAPWWMYVLSAAVVGAS